MVGGFLFFLSGCETASLHVAFAQCSCSWSFASALLQCLEIHVKHVCGCSSSYRMRQSCSSIRNSASAVVTWRHTTIEKFMQATSRITVIWSQASAASPFSRCNCRWGMFPEIVAEGSLLCYVQAGARQVTGSILHTKLVTMVGHRLFLGQKTCDCGWSQVLLRP